MKFKGGNGHFYDFNEMMAVISSEAKMTPIEVIIGTDSQPHANHLTFVTVVVCRRIGKGSRVFVRSFLRKRNLALKWL